MFTIFPMKCDTVGQLWQLIMYTDFQVQIPFLRVILSFSVHEILMQSIDIQRIVFNSLSHYGKPHLLLKPQFPCFSWGK